jgi:hypothetical protein
MEPTHRAANNITPSTRDHGVRVRLDDAPAER